MYSLAELLPPDRIAVLNGRNKQEVIREMVTLISSSPLIKDPETVYKAVMDRERILSTGIGLGIAVPHARLDSVSDIVAAFGKTTLPIEYGSIDDEPVRIVVMIAAATRQQHDYIRALAKVTLFLKKDHVRGDLLAAETREELARIVAREA